MKVDKLNMVFIEDGGANQAIETWICEEYRLDDVQHIEYILHTYFETLPFEMQSLLM